MRKKTKQNLFEQSTGAQPKESEKAPTLMSLHKKI